MLDLRGNARCKLNGRHSRNREFLTVMNQLSGVMRDSLRMIDTSSARQAARLSGLRLCTWRIIETLPRAADGPEPDS